MNLPGDVKRVINSDQDCDACENIAEYRIQGETDSFGAEYMYFCEACKKDHDASVKMLEPEVAICEWCKKKAEVQPIRDWTEGLNGPVYYVCEQCVSKQNKEIREEFEFEFEKHE